MVKIRHSLVCYEAPRVHIPPGLVFVSNVREATTASTFRLASIGLITR